MLQTSSCPHDKPGDPEYAERLACFEARIGRGDKV